MNNWGIPKEIEREVRKRDIYCVYCGVKMRKSAPQGKPRKDVATWEHIVNDASIITIDNIALCCTSCNSSKGTKTLSEWFQSDFCARRNISQDKVAKVVQKAYE